LNVGACEPRQIAGRRWASSSALREWTESIQGRAAINSHAGRDDTKDNGAYPYRYAPFVRQIDRAQPTLRPHDP
jgi:hypothetical protein